MVRAILFTFCFILFQLLLPFLTPQPAYAASCKAVQIGDSLTAGMVGFGDLKNKYTAKQIDPIIPGDGYSGHSLSGGGSPDGLTVIQNSKNDIKSANVVVMELGTNRAEPSAAAFGTALNKAVTDIHTINPNAKILWVNLAGNPAAAELSARNKVIYAASGITVVDWYHTVYPTGDPKNIDASLPSKNGWLEPDPMHLHPTADGYKAFSDLIVGAAKTACAGGSGSDSTGGSGGVPYACFITKVGNPKGPPPELPSICSTTAGGEGGGGTATECPTGPQSPTGDRLTPQARCLKDQVLAQFPFIKEWGGCCGNGSGIGEHPLGRAIDFIIAPALGQTNPIVKANGDKVAKWIIANYKPLHIYYIGWYGNLWGSYSNPPGWKPMCSFTHPELCHVDGPASITSAHMDHVHVSVY
jgi:lysophospholipase L1-like esterase